MPKIRIIHEDKDTTLDLIVSHSRGVQKVSIAAGGDYEFNLDVGGTLDIGVQKNVEPNMTMLQRVGDMLHFRRDTAAGKLNAGTQPAPEPASLKPTEAQVAAANAAAAANQPSPNAAPAPVTASSGLSATTEPTASPVESASVETGNALQAGSAVSASTETPIPQPSAEPSEPGAEKAPE
jgi:hypothetical protein